MSGFARGLERLEPRRLLADTLSATLDGTQVRQSVDAIGAALNSGWQPSEYRSPAFMNQVIGDLGVSALRSALDAGWELTNDNNDPNTFNWTKFDDTAIGTTMEFFAQAKARGVNTFLLTVWTPPAWMKTNKAATNGGQLRADQRAEFAEYVAAAVIRAKTKWGVDITQVSIANEPWFTEPYVSSMWTPAQYRETLKAVAAKFAREGLTTQLVGPEDVSSIFRTQKYIQAIADDPVANAAFPIIGSHYLIDQNMQTLAAQAQALGKKVWYTEIGNGNADIAGAVGLARGMDSAFVRGQANAWINWQLSNTSSFESLMKSGVPTIKYYAFKQFAHFVRPGAQRVDVNYGSTGDLVRIAAFKDPNTGATTIVLSNRGTTDVDVNLSIKNLALPATFQQYRTSATENCVRLADLAGAANTIASLPANSIVTLYAGPDLVTPQLTTASTRVTPTQWADAWNTNALRQAAFKGDYEQVKTLIANGADVNAAFGNGWTPLFTAAASPYNKADLIVQALLNAGADFNKKDVEGLTPLHVAAMNQIGGFGTVQTTAAERVKALLAAGADVNARDAYGRTPLMYAAMMPKLGGDFAKADTSSIEALLAAGADQTLVDSGGRTARDWAVAESAPEAVALLSPPGSIEAHVFKDTNGNGTQDAAEPGLANVTVYIDLNSNAMLDVDEPTMVTNSTGVAVFVDQLIGTYSLRAVAPDATYTPAEVVASATVTSAGIATAILPFVPPVPPVNPGTSTLSGYVVNDKNQDALWSSGEAGLAGRTVYIDSNANGTLDAGELSVVTASNGKYLFSNIGAGTYSVRQIVPTGCTQTKPAGNGALTTTIKDGVVRGGLDFYVYNGTVTPPPPPPPPPPGDGTASIKAYVVNDTNKDGKWTSGEKGLTGRTVWLDLDNDNMIDANEATATTGTNGVFSFTNLAAGTYFVRQVLPAGWTQTAPAANAPLTIKLTDGQAKSGSSLLTALV